MSDGYGVVIAENPLGIRVEINQLGMEKKIDLCTVVMYHKDINKWSLTHKDGPSTWVDGQNASIFFPDNKELNK